MAMTTRRESMTSSRAPVGRNHRAVVVLTLALAVSVSVPSVEAQSAGGLAAFAGTWTINLERSTMGRAGPNGVQTRRSNAFTWVFTPDVRGLRMDIYADYPAAVPTKTLAVIPDGRQHPCEMKESCLGAPGDPKEQSYSFSQMNGNMLVRVFQVRGVSVEYNVYAVSADGGTFVATSWSPQTPEFQNVQVFEKGP
jgi:hypothetical protein